MYKSAHAFTISFLYKRTNTNIFFYISQTIRTTFAHASQSSCSSYIRLDHITYNAIYVENVRDYIENKCVFIWFYMHSVWMCVLR